MVNMLWDKDYTRCTKASEIKELVIETCGKIHEVYGYYLNGGQPFSFGIFDTVEKARKFIMDLIVFINRKEK